MSNRLKQHVIPGYKQFIEPNKAHADFIIDNNADGKEGMDLTVLFQIVEEKITALRNPKSNSKQCPKVLSLFSHDQRHSKGVSHKEGINRGPNNTVASTS